MQPFFELHGLATGSSVVLESRDAALAFPRGDMILAFCNSCGFIANIAFSATLADEAARHEDSQAFSGTFNRYLQTLSAELIARHGLRGKRIVEVGCGQGEFLALLCKLGPNEGIGFDPVIDEERGILGTALNTRAVRDWFDETTPPQDADLVCCKMTLEHIDAVAPFVRSLRRALRPRLHSAVFAQVPESLRILRSCAFEDVYYEHCSYFTPGTLARLFRSQGFEVDRLEVSYSDQYLSIEGHPAGFGPPVAPLDREEPVAEVAALVADFPQRYASRTSQWRELIDARAAEGPVALWGSGSKAVSFMKSLGLGERIEHVVDVNPHRQGRYIACTGQRILAPAEIAAVKPRAVVVMNAVYREEIRSMLAELGVDTEVLAL